MSRIITFLLLICLNAGLSYGMVCSIGHKNALSKILDSCPGLLDSQDKSYCCMNFETNEMYCCDSMEFAMRSAGSLLMVIVITGFLLSLVIACISCFCCSCCPWYRRRQRVTVYGRVENPNAVHIIQTPANVPQPVPQYINITHPANSSGMTYTQPPYTQAMYEKQAPYNPNYVPPNYK